MSVRLLATRLAGLGAALALVGGLAIAREIAFDGGIMTETLILITTESLQCLTPEGSKATSAP